MFHRIPKLFGFGHKFGHTLRFIPHGCTEIDVQKDQAGEDQQMPHSCHIDEWIDHYWILLLFPYWSSILNWWNQASGSNYIEFWSCIIRHSPWPQRINRFIGIKLGPITFRWIIWHYFFVTHLTFNIFLQVTFVFDCVRAWNNILRGRNINTNIKINKTYCEKNFGILYIKKNRQQIACEFRDLVSSKIYNYWRRIIIKEEWLKID